MPKKKTAVPVVEETYDNEPIEDEVTSRMNMLGITILICLATIGFAALVFWLS